MTRKNKTGVYSAHVVQQEPTYTVKNVQHQGLPYLVVPVVMMVEGVHNGSRGPLYHTIAELGKFPEAWNGRPVIVDHPEIDGQNVSANSPEIVEQQVIGTVFNTHVDDTKLKAEVWLNEEKLRQISPAVLASLQRCEPIEVSVGVFSEEEEVEGDWNGEHYTAIAHNHRPDHLALLPGGCGACSVEDGCGIRANKKKGGNDVNENEFLQTLKSFYVDLINLNSVGYKELVDAARNKIDRMDSENTIHFLHEVFEDSVIYEIRQRVGGVRLYKQGYKFENGTFELEGMPMEVQRKVEYEVLAQSSGMIRTKFNINNNKEVNEMAENAKGCTPCVKAAVDKLIANGKGRFVETDREWLEALSEDQLKKMEPQVIEKEVTTEVNVLSEEDRAIIDYVKFQKKEQRKSTIAQIQADAEAGTWTDDELNAMSDATLSKVAGMVKKEQPANYALFGAGGFDLNASGEEPMEPTGVKFEK